MEPRDQLYINKEGASHVQSYIDFLNMGGKEKDFSEKAYLALKQKQKEAAKNKLYVTWRNANGKDCKNIGVATKCFCNHRYIVI